jgi:signal transduction histidine kinase
MDTVSVLLLDTTDIMKLLLEKQLSCAKAFKINVTLAETKYAVETLQENYERWDVILFGENTTPTVVRHFTKLIRARDVKTPILLLTRLSEARVSRNLQKIGVDDMLNIAEINSPVFSWTFMSTLRQAEVRKKAEEFDVIRNRLQQVNSSLAFITHEINNPLSVIRLALYQLTNRELSKPKKELFFKLLVENVGRVDAQLKDLYEVRRQLGEDTSILAKVLSAKATKDTLTL